MNIKSKISSLKGHLVGPVVLSKGKVGSKVVLQQRSSLNSLEDGGIHLLLVSLALIRDNSGLGGIIGEESFLTIGRLGGGTGKVGIGNAGHINSTNIDLGGGSDNISLVDTTEGNTVNLVGSSHKEKTRIQCLQADNTLSTEASREEDTDGSGGEGGADLGGVLLLGAGVLVLGHVVGGVVTGGFAGGGGCLGGLLGAGGSEYAKSVGHFDGVVS
mmetsp:Transcript_8449/g.12765  ORF Transcript_8449/g.12765 Transcript_8449/m.12765 type:complete len:215 (-) Transcript_8449:8-652(-)